MSTTPEHLPEDADLTADEARRLTDQLKIQLEAGADLISRLYLGRAWIALGYQSWDAYVSNEFQTSRLRLPREERAQTVCSLRESGLSIRAIASTTGLGRGTVQREIEAGVPNGTPQPGAGEVTIDDDTVTEAEIVDDAGTIEPKAPVITGTDGKTYKPRRRRSRHTAEPLPPKALVSSSADIDAATPRWVVARERRDAGTDVTLYWCGPKAVAGGGMSKAGDCWSELRDAGTDPIAIWKTQAGVEAAYRASGGTLKGTRYIQLPAPQDWPQARVKCDPSKKARLLTPDESRARKVTVLTERIAADLGTLLEVAQECDADAKTALWSGEHAGGITAIADVWRQVLEELCPKLQPKPKRTRQTSPVKTSPVKTSPVKTSPVKPTSDTTPAADS